MNAKTMEALRGSRDKWRAIVDSPEAEDRGAENCPLCAKFRTESNCVGCPVEARTGKSYCIGTPYIKWAKHQVGVHGTVGVLARKPGCAECLRLAKAELAFLESLLPEGDK